MCQAGSLLKMYLRLFHFSHQVRVPGLAQSSQNGKQSLWQLGLHMVCARGFFEVHLNQII